MSFNSDIANTNQLIINSVHIVNNHRVPVGCFIDLVHRPKNCTLYLKWTCGGSNTYSSPSRK